MSIEASYSSTESNYKRPQKKKNIYIYIYIYIDIYIYIYIYISYKIKSNAPVANNSLIFTTSLHIIAASVRKAREKKNN